MRTKRIYIKQLAAKSALIYALLASSASYAKPVLGVAVAANFIQPMQAIAKQFETQCECKLRLSFGSSGKLYAQILHGAPFDVFLSADTDKPQQLVQRGKALASSRFTYARGTLVLWSSQGHALSVEQRLKSGQFNKIALANPALAPYGKAAQQVLHSLGLQAAVAKKQVIGENIAQAFQFVSTGNAELGLVALSQLSVTKKAFTNKQLWRVPAPMYQAIRQDAVLLLRAQHNQQAQQLLAFLKTEALKTQLVGYGYSPERAAR